MICALAMGPAKGCWALVCYAVTGGAGHLNGEGGEEDVALGLLAPNVQGSGLVDEEGVWMRWRLEPV